MGSVTVLLHCQTLLLYLKYVYPAMIFSSELCNFVYAVELSNMSFEEIMQLQNRVGTKAYNKIAYGTDSGKKKKKPDQMKRLNKHK